MLAGTALVAIVAVIAVVVVRSDRHADVAQRPEPTQPIQPAPDLPVPTLGPTMPPTPPPTSPPAAPATIAPTQRPGSPPTVAPLPTTTRPPVAPGLTEQTSRVYPKQEYFLYVPKSYDGSARYGLLVVVHGDGRHVQEYTEQFTDFADEKRYIILAPYFPTGERFQQLGIGEKEKTIRFDERLLGLVAEIGGRLNVEQDRFDLFGFSAGGQFAHRFLYLHPERLRSVVVASPGTVTVPNARYDWPAGFGELDDLANVRVNLDRVREVRVMLVVGKDDVGDDNLRETDEANRFGKTRLERARTLHEEWDDAKIGHQYVEIKGLDHTLDERIVEPATRFFANP
jgi:poly(3-hydroxybutyrate) depolymerase